MPIRIDKKLPAVEILRTENIFVMYDQRAAHQDIRPLKILILNLMTITKDAYIGQRSIRNSVYLCDVDNQK